MVEQEGMGAHERIAQQEKRMDEVQRSLVEVTRDVGALTANMQNLISAVETHDKHLSAIVETQTSNAETNWTNWIGAGALVIAVAGGLFAYQNKSISSVQDRFEQSQIGQTALFKQAVESIEKVAKEQGDTIKRRFSEVESFQLKNNESTTKWQLEHDYRVSHRNTQQDERISSLMERMKDIELITANNQSQYINHASENGETHAELRQRVLGLERDTYPGISYRSGIPERTLQFVPTPIGED